MVHGEVTTLLSNPKMGKPVIPGQLWYNSKQFQISKQDMCQSMPMINNLGGKDCIHEKQLYCL